MGPKAEKVGKPKAEKAEKPPKEKTPAINYMTTSGAAALLDAERRLTAVPTDFNYDTMESLKKGDFASEHLFMTWKANELDFRAARLTAKATQLRTEADNAKKFGDPATRSKLKRHAKLLEKLKELQAELKAQGATLEDGPASS